MPGPRLYNLFPLLAGPITGWVELLDRIIAMGFDWVFINPFHYPGFSGSLYAVKDYYRLHPLVQGDSRESPEELLSTFVRAAQRRGLRVAMDLVINHTSKDSLLAEQHPEFFEHEKDGSLRSPSAIDPADSRKVTVWGDLAEIDFSKRPEREALVAYWKKLVVHHAALGFRGFRCDAAYKVPAEVWTELIEEGRTCGDVIFFAETLGCRLAEAKGLAGAGFDYFFNSSKWWDFRAPWLLEQYQSFRSTAPSIAFPESHDTPRLVAELRDKGVKDVGAIEAFYRQRYLFAAFFSSGLMMPMGFDRGYDRKLDVVTTRPEHAGPDLFDLGPFIAATHRAKTSIPALNVEGPQTLLTPPGSPVVGMLRETENSANCCVALINPSTEWREIEIDSMPRVSRLPLSVACDTWPGAVQGDWRPGGRQRLAPLAVSLLRSP
ncbi:MAG: alpha-amylase [Deltaproteobacteria bacterium]|nr:alpha-amylase [Deltaproteobacteria bacterium]